MIDQNYILTYRSLSGHRCNKSAKRPKEGRKKVKNKLNIKLIFNTVEIDNYKTCISKAHKQNISTVQKNYFKIKRNCK